MFLLKFANMNLLQLFRNIRPFVRPYRLLVFVTLVLTLVGSMMQQVNAIVLDRTVDAINALIGTDFSWSQARIDQGVSSLSRTVQNFFIDLLPSFSAGLRTSTPPPQPPPLPPPSAILVSALILRANCREKAS